MTQALAARMTARGARVFPTAATLAARGDELVGGNAERIAGRKRELEAFAIVVVRVDRRGDRCGLSQMIVELVRVVTAEGEIDAARIAQRFEPRDRRCVFGERAIPGARELIVELRVRFERWIVRGAEALGGERELVAHV